MYKKDAGTPKATLRVATHPQFRACPASTHFIGGNGLRLNVARVEMLPEVERQLGLGSERQWGLCHREPCHESGKGTGKKHVPVKMELVSKQFLA